MIAKIKTWAMALVLAVFVLGVNSAQARIIYYGSEMETVTLAYGTTTILRFPEEVKTISQASRFEIAPADENNPDYAVLAVSPRFAKGSNKVTFILADGSVLATELVVVPGNIPEKTDSFYDFKKKESLIELPNAEQRGTNLTELELMKAMIRWDTTVVGYNARSLIRTVRSVPDDLSAKLVRVYTGPHYNGYVFKLKNESKKKTYVIDVRSLVLGRPNQAVLSQVDNGLLKPAGHDESETYLRIVAKPSSVYYNVNLPVAPIKEEK